MSFTISLKPLNGEEFGVNLSQVDICISLALCGCCGSSSSCGIQICKSSLFCSDECLDLANETIGSSLERCGLLRSGKCSCDFCRGSSRCSIGIFFVSLCKRDGSLSIIEGGLSGDFGGILFSGTSVLVGSSESSLSTISCSFHLVDQGVKCCDCSREFCSLHGRGSSMSI